MQVTLYSQPVHTGRYDRDNNSLRYLSLIVITIITQLFFESLFYNIV